MNPLTSSILGLLFLGTGLAAALIMLDLKGRQKDRINSRKWVIYHRVLGYLFFATYLFMLAVMIIRISRYQEELAPRLIFHLVLALIIFPLAGLKILVARRLKLFTSRLIFLGSSIFILAFVFIVITAGYYFLYSSHVTYVSISELDTNVMDENIGRHLVISKCSKCHTLERIFRSFKTQESWTETINRMAKIDAPNIRDYDVKQIINFLLMQQDNRRNTPESLGTEIGKSLLEQKCSVCHNLERIYKSSKGELEWQSTLEKMVKMSGSPDYLSETEKKEIIIFLLSQKIE